MHKSMDWEFGFPKIYTKVFFDILLHFSFMILELIIGFIWILLMRISKTKVISTHL